jgi:integral membrane protein
MINLFRVVSFLEGVSYLLLMFLGMPYKYLESLGNDPVYVKMFGMPHGLLFVAYIVLAILLKPQLNWNTKEFGIVCLLSVLPFGTFFVGKYLKQERVTN